MFVTIDVRKQFRLLIDTGEIDEAWFFKVVDNFYEESLGYINKWKCNLENVEKFEWVLLKKTSELNYIHNFSLSVGQVISWIKECIFPCDQWVCLF